ncbi:hypothetical protein F66182_16226 [Fusarium sp. NRRL 66182]|nr:hypothetical protein F66182_16226 [Fusarium sp. NRRL 66182]
MFFSVGVQNHLSLLSTSTIGHQLGFWLRSFHNWSLTPEQVALRAQVWQNDHMRELKYSFTYGSVLKALENFPELLKSHKETLDTIGDFLAKEDQRMSKEGGDGYSVLHGDFWSGNILIDNAGWREPPLLGRTNELFVIDWEFSHFGHRSCDLGQIVGDLYERKIYGNFDTAISIMKGVIDGYGTLSDEMAFRTAIYYPEAGLYDYYLITCGEDRSNTHKDDLHTTSTPFRKSDPSPKSA